MSEEKKPNEGEMEVPKAQNRMDNLIWLFALSLLISLIVYNAWGLVELAIVPDFIP